MLVDCLKEKIGSENFLLIDIREPYEFEDGSICSTNIPLAQIMNNLEQLVPEKEIVIYCKSGKRSKSLKFILEKIHGLKNIDHLEGGYQAWLEKNTNLND